MDSRKQQKVVGSRNGDFASAMLSIRPETILKIMGAAGRKPAIGFVLPLDNEMPSLQDSQGYINCTSAVIANVTSDQVVGFSRFNN